MLQRNYDTRNDSNYKLQILSLKCRTVYQHYASIDFHHSDTNTNVIRNEINVIFLYNDTCNVFYYNMKVSCINCCYVALYNCLYFRCRCAARDRLTDTYDTITQVLHKNILPYVALVQAVLHTPPGLTDEFGRLKISVGDIECSTPLM